MSVSREFYMTLRWAIVLFRLLFMCGNTKNRNSFYTQRLLLGIVLLFRSITVLGQSPSPVFDHNTHLIYGQDKGLPQNSVVSMCFDKWGFLWMGTTDGLARFDGRSFKTFTGKSKNSYIQGFVRINADTILAVTVQDEAMVITKGNVASTIPDQLERFGIPIFPSFCSITPQRSLYWSTLLKKDITNALRSNYWRSGYWYGNDSFLIVGGRQLYLYTMQGLADSVAPKKSNSYFGFGSTLILNKSIVNLDNVSEKLEVYDLAGNMYPVALPAQGHSNWRMYSGPTSDHFFITADSLLYEVRQDIATGKIKYILLLNNFASKAINMIINLNNELLLVATAIDGIHLYKKNKTLAYNGLEFLNKGSSYYAQALMPDNKTVLTGANKLFNQNGFVTNIPALEKANSKAIYKDSHNYYWYNINENVYKTRDLYAPQAKPVANTGNPFQYFEDSKDNLWIVGENTCGYFASGTTRYKDLAPYIKNNTNGIAYPINTIAEDKNGHILLGAKNGIFIFNPSAPGEGFKPFALANAEIKYIRIDPITGYSWVVVRGRGLCVIKNEGKNIIFFPPDKYGDLQSAHFFVTDSNKMTWISSNRGLFVIPEKRLQEYAQKQEGNLFYFKLSKNDGLATNEFNGICQTPMLLLPDGSLTISSIEGLAWVHTGNFKAAFSKDDLFLDKTDSAGCVTLLENGATLFLKQNQNKDISLQLSFADWNDDFNIETAYLFSKDDENTTVQWQPLASDYKITFPFLAHGNYTLKVRKRVGFGATDYIYSTISIKVLPAWYQTKWMYLALILLLLVLIKLIDLIRNRQLQKANQFLSSRIQQATYTLQQKNTELATLNDTKAKLITMFNHDISVPLFYINQMLQQMALDKNITALSPSYTENLTLMSNTVSDLNIIMNDLLYWVKLQQYNISLKLQHTPVNTREIIESTLHLFHFRITSNNINVNTAIDDDLTILTDEHLFKSILYNVISNAIKFTQTGYLSVQMQRDKNDPNRFLLVIENSASPKEKRIQSSSFTAVDKSEAIQSRGIGLLLVEDFAAMLQLSIKYKLDEGGVFTVIIKGAI